MIYTIISNREAYTDYCRGCDMGSSDSEFYIYATDDRTKAVEKATYFYIRSLSNINKKLNKDYNLFTSADIYVLVNGVGDNTTIETDIEQQAEYDEFLYEESRNIDHEAYSAAKINIEKLELAELEQQKKNEEIIKERLEQIERAEYEKLKEKFKGE